MNNLHTEENYLRYYYGEADLFETLESDFQLSDDISSNINYSHFVEQIQILDRLSIQPSQNSIENILAYSKNSALGL